MKKWKVQGIAYVGLVMALACGAPNATDWDQEVAKATEVVEEGGASPFQGRLVARAPEAMAIQEVPFAGNPASQKALEQALCRYRNQWTFQLTFGPRPTMKSDPNDLFRYDIENNGGMWRDRSRNLQRLMFEMGGFIRLKLPDGKELEPILVEFQRTFGMGLERSFIMVFPKEHEGRRIEPPFEIRVKEFGQGTGTMTFSVKKAPGEMGFWRVKRMWKASAEKSEG